MGLGFIGAIGGLGASMSNQAAIMQSEDDKAVAFDRQKALEEWRLSTAETYRVKAEDRAEERKNAPLNRLSAAAKAKMQEDVPVQAEPVKALTADPTMATGGMTGNYDELAKRAANLPEEDRAGYLSQIQRQRDTQQTAADTAAAGKTRKRTADEAFDTALSESKINDPQAYVAGRALATDKTTKVGANESIIDSRTGKVIFANTAGADTAMLLQDRKEQMQARALDAASERNEARIEAMLEKSDRKGGGAAGSQERIGYSNLLNETGRRLAEANKNLAMLQQSGTPKPGSEEARTMATLTEDVQQLRQERATYQKMLLGSLGAPDMGTGKADTAAPTASQAPTAAQKTDNRGGPISTLPPGAKQIGTSQGKPVYQTPDGQRFTVK